MALQTRRKLRFGIGISVCEDRPCVVFSGSALRCLVARHGGESTGFPGLRLRSSKFPLFSFFFNQSINPGKLIVDAATIARAGFSSSE